MIESSPPSKVKWEITREAFDRLLACLDPDRERAGEQYEALRYKLIKFLEWRGCLAAEEYADETLNRVARKIDEGETIRDLSSYCSAVARLVLHEALRKQEREQRALDREPAAPHTDTPEADHRIGCFEECLRSLPVESRELIREYYVDEKRAKIDRRRQLADRMGIPLNALRIRAHRIRAKLEHCVASCVSRGGSE
jgi:RNA polymerase sigma factor (sigma-70 family)